MKSTDGAHEVLAALTGRVKGAMIATWLGPEGEVLVSYPSGLPNEAPLLFADLLSTAHRLHQGQLRATLIELEGAALIVVPLRDGSALLLVLRPEAPIGQGLFELRKAAFWWDRGRTDGEYRELHLHE